MEKYHAENANWPKVGRDCVSDAEIFEHIFYYVNRHGVPRAGSRVFIQTEPQIDGRRDLPFQVSAVVPDA